MLADGETPGTVNTIIHGDCLEVLPGVPACSVDLIVTSPPYADNRMNSYGGIAPDQYVEWFLPIAAELKRVLSDRGTFILNIKEKVVNGERHTYVLELILALKQQGWLWTEEYIWHKTNPMPGKWPNRFRDGWERCLQFNKTKQFDMYQDSVMLPIGQWAESRLRNLSEADKRRRESETGSKFGRNISRWSDRKLVYPSNVLHFAAECSNRNHSAVFPRTLPEWFIKCFSKENDLILDPFLGSGTTAIVATQLKRRCIGIEKQQDYYNLALSNLSGIVQGQPNDRE